MTVFQFPSPVELARRFVEAHGYLTIPLPQEPEIDLTPTELEVLGHLGRIPRSSRWLSTEVYRADSTIRHILASLKRKGLAIRTGHYHSGGWVRVSEELELLKAA